jgi:hypothetical protein
VGPPVLGRALGVVVVTAHLLLLVVVRHEYSVDRRVTMPAALLAAIDHLGRTSL